MWKKQGKYYELVAEQRSDDWYRERKCMITGSILESVLGWNKYQTTSGVVSEIFGLCEEKEITPAMQRGIDGEDGLRKSFFNEVMKGWKCEEPSLCLGTTVYDYYLSDGSLFSQVYGQMKDNIYHPQWFIAASPDGIGSLIVNGEIVDQVTLECKCPEFLYENLRTNTVVKHELKNLVSEKKDIIIETNMKVAHLIQMYGQMAATQIDKGYYLVGYEKPVPGYYYQLITFNEQLWKEKIYPSLVKFITLYLIPSMTAVQRQQHEEKVKKILTEVGEFSETLIPVVK